MHLEKLEVVACFRGKKDQFRRITMLQGSWLSCDRHKVKIPARENLIEPIQSAGSTLCEAESKRCLFVFLQSFLKNTHYQKPFTVQNKHFSIFTPKWPTVADKKGQCDLCNLGTNSFSLPYFFPFLVPQQQKKRTYRKTSALHINYKLFFLKTGCHFP